MELLRNKKYAILLPSKHSITKLHKQIKQLLPGMKLRWHHVEPSIGRFPHNTKNKLFRSDFFLKANQESKIKSGEICPIAESIKVVPALWDRVLWTIDFRRCNNANEGNYRGLWCYFHMLC